MLTGWEDSVGLKLVATYHMHMPGTLRIFGVPNLMNVACQVIPCPRVPWDYLELILIRGFPWYMSYVALAFITV